MKDETIGQQYIDAELRQKVLDFFTKFADVAENSVGKVRLFALVGVLSTCWITYYLYQSFSLSLTSTITSLFVLVVPALFLSKLYGALQEIIGLPRRIDKVMESLKKSALQVQGELSNRLSATKDGNQRRPRFRDIFKMARLFLRIKGILGEAAGMTEVMGSALLLSNPLFMIVAGISIALILLQSLISSITALIFIF